MKSSQVSRLVSISIGKSEQVSRSNEVRSRRDNARMLTQLCQRKQANASTQVSQQKGLLIFRGFHYIKPDRDRQTDGQTDRQTDRPGQ